MSSIREASGVSVSQRSQQQSPLTPPGRILSISSQRSLQLVDISTGEAIAEEDRHFLDCRFSVDPAHLWVTRRLDVETVAVELRDGRTLGVDLAKVVHDPFGGYSYFDLFRHPDPRTTSIWVAAGQDGQCLAWAHVQGARLEGGFFPELEECTFADMAPDGSSFLVVVDGEVRLYTYPQGELLKSIVWPDQDENEWTEYAFFAGPEHAITQSSANHMYVVDLRKARFGDEVVVAGHPPRRVSEIPRVPREIDPGSGLRISMGSGDGHFVSTYDRHPPRPESERGASRVGATRTAAVAISWGEISESEMSERLQKWGEELEAYNRGTTRDVVTWRVGRESLDQ